MASVWLVWFADPFLGPDECRSLGKLLDFAAPLGQLRVLLAAARMHHALPPHRRALALDTARGQRTLPHLTLMYKLTRSPQPAAEYRTTNATQSLRRRRVNRARVRFTLRSLRSPLRRSTVASQWPRAATFPTSSALSASASPPLLMRALPTCRAYRCSCRSSGPMLSGLPPHGCSCR